MEFSTPAPVGPLSTLGASFALIFLAEFGDKSQIVCMTLAAKYRPWPVLLGSTAAFAVLNLLAVAFGAVVASWVPDFWLALIVAGLFFFFGLQSLLSGNELPDGDKPTSRSSHGLFITTLLMIFVAEFGDKTQLAVAGLSSAYHGLPVWIGATLALLCTSLLGIIAGQRILKRLPLPLIHKLSGILFLLFAVIALFQAYR